MNSLENDVDARASSLKAMILLWETFEYYPGPFRLREGWSANKHYDSDYFLCICVSMRTKTCFCNEHKASFCSLSHFIGNKILIKLRGLSCVQHRYYFIDAYIYILYTCCQFINLVLCIVYKHIEPINFVIREDVAIPVEYLLRHFDWPEPSLT